MRYLMICRVCGHTFRRAKICNPNTLRPWDCNKRSCTGYATIETFSERLSRLVPNGDALAYSNDLAVRGRILDTRKTRRTQ